MTTHLPRRLADAAETAARYYPATPTVTVATDQVVQWANLMAETAPRVAALEATADAHTTLLAAVRRAVADLDDHHERDDDTGVCEECYPADSTWPCVTRMIADELRAAVAATEAATSEH